MVWKAVIATMRILKAGVYHDDCGFTLVELSMVILVLAIVMATVMPRFAGTLERQHLRSTINGIYGTVRYFDGDVCRLETSRELRAYALPADVRVLDVVSPQGTKTREGDAVTHFHPTGLAEPSIIHLGTYSNQKATLMIEPLAGRVKVFDDYVEQKTS